MNEFDTVKFVDKIWQECFQVFDVNVAYNQLAVKHLTD